MSKLESKTVPSVNDARQARELAVNEPAFSAAEGLPQAIYVDPRHVLALLLLAFGCVLLVIYLKLTGRMWLAGAAGLAAIVAVVQAVSDSHAPALTLSREGLMCQRNALAKSHWVSFAEIRRAAIHRGQLRLVAAGGRRLVIPLWRLGAADKSRLRWLCEGGGSR